MENFIIFSRHVWATKNEVCRTLGKTGRPDVDMAKVEQLRLTLFHDKGAELQTPAFFALAGSQRHGQRGAKPSDLLRSCLGRARLDETHGRYPRQRL